MTNIFTTRNIRVPGLLPDDALQEQLRQYTQQQKDMAQAAPPANSAIEFQNEIADSIVNTPSPTYKAPEPTPLPRVSVSERAPDRGPALAPVGIGGRGLDNLFNYLGFAGTLTPEERTTEAGERLRQAEDRAAQVEAEFRDRARFRAMSPEERAATANEMGLPLPPGKPSLAQEGASLLADIENLNEARSQVEAARGGVTDPSKAPTQEWWLNAMQVGAREAARTGIGALKFPTIVYEGIRDALVRGEGERSEGRAWLDGVDKLMTDLLPGDKARSKDFITQLSAGTGSMAAFMTAGIVGTLAKLPAFVTVGGLGAATGGAQMFEEAEGFSATAYQKYVSMLLGAGLGVLEAVPIDRMFMRADNATGGLVRRMLNTSGAGALEEFVQELSQALGEDVIAKYIAGFDPDREIDAREILQRGIIGAITGGAAGAAAGAMGGGEGAEGGQEPDAAQQEEIASAVIQQTQITLDDLLGPDRNEGALPTFATGMDVTAAADTETAAPPAPVAASLEGNGLRMGDVVAQLGQTATGAPALTLAPVPEPAAPQTFRGGTPPQVRDDGRVEVYHWSGAPFGVIDPAKRGTGPLRGVERQRLGPPGSGDPNAVDRSYYGVGDPDFAEKFRAENKKRKPRDRGYMEPTAPYHREGLGPYRHVVSVDPNEIYNMLEDPLGLRAQLDPEAAQSERITQYERLIRDAGFKGYWLPSSPLGQTAALFEPQRPERIINERTGEEVVPEADDVAAMLSPDRQRDLSQEVPGFGKVAPYLTPTERQRLRKGTAQKLLDIFDQMPDAEEMAAVAISGRSKRGWYARSAKALLDIFGLEDAPRFAALLAALSPQNSVEQNAINALRTWVEWDRAGRPTDRKKIERVLVKAVGYGRRESVLDAWVNNTVTSLSTPDATEIELSGPKVDSFMRNLMGVTVEVTNDAWMANYANIEQSLLGGSDIRREGLRIKTKSPGYMAMSAAVRRAAEIASDMTGETWTPAEIQETVWSWAKTLYENASDRSVKDLLEFGGVSAEDIANTPDFASLFTSGVYRTILETGGYGEQVAETGGERAAGPSGAPREITSAEGTSFDQGVYEAHLRAAAERLDAVREERLGRREPVIVDDIGDTFAMLVDDANITDDDLRPLPGLPKNSTGPIESVVRAARAYADSIGLPLRRQSEYVQADPDRGARIAAAYDAMEHNPSDPAVAAAYDALIEETLAQYQFVKASGVEVEFIEPKFIGTEHPDYMEVWGRHERGTGEKADRALRIDGRIFTSRGDHDVAVEKAVAAGFDRAAIDARAEFGLMAPMSDPYPEGPKQVLADLQRGHLWVFPTDSGFGSLTEITDNPLLRPTDEKIGDRVLLANDVFRIVHDFFGHGLEGSGFGARGEENAWQSHMRLFTPAAIPAMTSETRGQNSWVNFGPYGEQNRANQRETVYADQKVGLMPEWTWQEGVDEDFLAMFAGQDAETLDAQGYETAKRMFDEGRSAEDIWTATGFFKGVDGMWRFEITDRDASLKPYVVTRLEEGLDVSRELHEVLEHTKLFDAYPELRFNKVTVAPTPDNGNGLPSGSFNEDTGEIRVYADDTADALSTLLHEVQHAVQSLESFARGGNAFMGEKHEGRYVDAARKMLKSAEERFRNGEVGQEVVNLWRDYYRQAAAYEYYRTIAGEVEARNVQTRLKAFKEGLEKGLSGSQLEPVFPPLPTDTEDVAREDQIIIARSTSGLGFQSMAAEPEAARRPKQPQKPGVGTSASRAPFRAEQTRPAGGIPMPGTAGADAANNDVNLVQISRNFIRLLDLTVRQGRITAAGGERVMGQFSRRQAVARLRSMSDLSTLVHEGGHALHDMMGQQLAAFTAKNETALMDVADKLYGKGLVDTAKLKRADHVREGFAELVRVYVLNRGYAERTFPALTAEFDTLLRTQAPEIATGMDAIGQQFAAYLQLPSAQLVRNMISDGRRETGVVNEAIQELREVGFRSWMSEYARRAVGASVNRYAALNRVVTDILNIGEENRGGPIDLKRADDPRVLIRLAGNAGARATVQLSDGVMAYRSTEPHTRSLREALVVSQGLPPDATPAQFDEERLADFDAYLVSRRALDEYRRFHEEKIPRPPINATEDDLRQAIADFEGKYGDAFINAAEIVHEFAMAMWQKQFDAGLMSKDVYQQGLDRQFYAPLQRDMSDRARDFAPTAVTGGRTLGKRMKGSDRNIVSPTSILMHKLYALEQTIAQNDVVKTLAALADRAGTAGALVERIPATKVIGQTLSVLDAAKLLAKDDTLTEMDAQDLMTILAASIKNGNSISLFRREQASTLGENIVFYWENGVVQALQLQDGEVGTDVMNLFGAIGRENMSLGVELIAGTSTFFRSMITKWPDFLIVNYIRDQMSAWILSDVGYKPFASGLRGMGDEIRQKTWARKANAAMMTMGGMNTAALHDARIRRDVDALAAKGYVAHVFSERSLRGAVKGFAKITELSETGTRLGLFRHAYERAKRDGLDDWEASIEAAYTATDYIDFGLSGSRMLMWRRVIPFLNAQLQGYYKMLRTLGADEVRQRRGLKFALGAYFKNVNNLPLSRTERQAIQVGRKAWVKMVSLGLISGLLWALFRDDEDYQETSEYLRQTSWIIPVGDGQIVSIPKPFELAIIANAVERGLEFASGDKEAVNRFVRGAAMTMVPPTAPPAIQLVVEYAANEDFFTGQEIVPDYMRALAPELQYNNYTSSLAKKIGEITGMSPMVLDHFMSGLGASAYRDVMAITNAMDPNQPSMDATDAPLLRRFIRDVRRGSASSRDFWAQASMLNGKLRSAEVSYRRYLEGGNVGAAERFLSTLSTDEKSYAILSTHFKAEYKRLNPFYRGRQITTIVSAMRRELVSDLGLENTDEFRDEPAIKLSPRQKAEIDTLLSELARREIRNTLVATGMPGWSGKERVDVEKTKDMISVLMPAVAEELERRMAKAKVYDAEAVFEGWPDARTRLIEDREDAFLDDLVTIAKVSP